MWKLVLTEVGAKAEVVSLRPIRASSYKKRLCRQMTVHAHPFHAWCLRIGTLPRFRKPSREIAQLHVRCIARSVL